MNTIALIGNLGGDADVRDVSGRKVANFSLAAKEPFDEGEPDISSGHDLPL